MKKKKKNGGWQENHPKYRNWQSPEPCLRTKALSDERDAPNSLPKCNRTREIELRNFKKNFNSRRFLEDLQAQSWAQLSFFMKLM